MKKITQLIKRNTLSSILNATYKKLKSLRGHELHLAIYFVLAFLTAMALRYKLLAAETFDYIYFLKPWHEHLSAQGLQGFSTGFANYNTPYLLLLYAVTKLPIGSLVAIKSISIFFDIVLALAVALVVHHYKPAGYAKFIAFITVLFLPTVFLNSSLWGQCDAIYTSFVVLSFYMLLKDNPKYAWLLWGVGFAFKLQAIFFLPFLIIYSFRKKWKWYVPLWGLLSFALLTIFPVFMGRPILDVLAVYVQQAMHPTAGQPMLAWFSATFYQFMPNEWFSYLKSAGLMLGFGAALAATAPLLSRIKLESRHLLLLASLCLLAVPYFLPGIHERYMFTAEIFMVIVAFVVPRFVWAAIAMQVVTIVTYNSYFTGGNGQPQIAYPILSLVLMGIIYALATYLYKEVVLGDSPNQTISKQKRAGYTLDSSKPAKHR